MEEIKKYSLSIGNKPLTLEFGKVAQQANGSVWVTYGGTTCIVTATASKEVREGIEFFPLTVDVEERLYSVGRIPGSWGRREGRPPDKAILQARLTDRPIRPLFPEGMRNDVQIVIMPVSIEHNYSPEIAGMIGASAALCVSDIPFKGPIGAVEVGLVDGEFVINPDVEQAESSALRLTVAGTEDAISMVEAGADQVSEDLVIDAMLVGHEAIKEICRFQKRIVAEIGKEKVVPTLFIPEEDVSTRVSDFVSEALRDAIRTEEKLEREAKIDEILERMLSELSTVFPGREGEMHDAFQDVVKAEVRSSILETGIRPDKRQPDDIRRIQCDVDVLPRVHGSAIFRRGQTQVMSITTLGATSDIQELDTTGVEEFKRFIHHYNFPPFSTGETRPMRGPGRRETGHGALVERALLPVMPDEDDFPYAIRVVSEVLESNGSSSMASVCGTSLSLMDAGVPVKAPVAGIAMGLVKDGDKAVILTDIQGMEDALGDMDFKVAGTAEGITALQMDIKIGGVSRDILRSALEKAKAARCFILERMQEAIPEPRQNLSEYAPRMVVVTIDPEKIRDVIGPGGKTINKITADTGAKIDIEQDGRVFITAPDEASGLKAKDIVETLTRDVEVGKVYTGKVTRIIPSGAFVEILPGKEGLVRISEISDEYVKRVEDVLNIGDEILVKVMEIDHMGRVNLSRRRAMGQDDDSKRKGDRGNPGQRGGRFRKA